jgi:glucose-6-phosphate isomerase
MRALLESLGPDDVFLTNYFLEDSAPIRASLDAIRHAVGASRTNATSIALGPRYLHSSGQLQKGGPNLFVGLHLWQSAASRTISPLEIPHLGGSFDRLAEAQAAGDFAVLAERGRRMIGIDVGADPVAAVARLEAWIQRALA